MDASYVIGVLRRQHAKLEDDALISLDNDLSIAIGRQQYDIRQRMQDLGDPSYVRTIIQEEVVGKGMAQGLWTEEQQAGKDPRSAASLGNWELNFLSLRDNPPPSQSWHLGKPGDHFGDMGRLSLVSNESLLSSATQLTLTSQETVASKNLPHNPSLRGHKDAAWGNGIAWYNECLEEATTTLPDYRRNDAASVIKNGKGGLTVISTINGLANKAQTSVDQQPTAVGMSARDCVACTPETQSASRLDVDCIKGHCYCKTCLVFMFQMASEDITRWVVRCCKGKVITLAEAAPFLPAELKARYAARSLEWGAEDPTYCHVQTCSCFLSQPDGARLEVLRCPVCSADTCIHCKQAAHEGGCVREALPDDLAKLAQDEEWQRCPSCERMVGLHHGCSHITCHCKTEWCYDCAIVWKNCTCPQWRRDRLLNRAARAAVREAIQLDTDRALAGFRDLVGEIREAGATCHHESLRRIYHPGNCDDCGHLLDDYLYRGCRCRLEICLWCRDTRHGLLGLRCSVEAKSWIKARDTAGRALRGNYKYRGGANDQRLSEATGVQRAERLRNELVRARSEDRRQILLKQMSAVENAIKQRLVDARQREALLQRFAAIETASEDAVEGIVADAVVEGVVRDTSGW